MTARLVSWQAVDGRGRSGALSERLPVALPSVVTVY
jgi:hypothetical protein